MTFEFADRHWDGRDQAYDEQLRQASENARERLRASGDWQNEEEAEREVRERTKRA